MGRASGDEYRIQGDGTETKHISDYTTTMLYSGVNETLLCF